MKLLLIWAKGNMDKEVKRSIENDVRQAINQGFFVYGMTLTCLLLMWIYQR
ncbi:hypothetical protein [Bacillus atrophaeus]|uniref:hypothetical protein n=1 Tax=Bacillus atrophaeus TaxID=1452 RepID=UPI00227FF8AE|nr:hypothetical protein [Bacillus atrophaeus]MCY8975649.1 hypothetical protein [Bacillus atrophaeus]